MRASETSSLNSELTCPFRNTGPPLLYNRTSWLIGETDIDEQTHNTTTRYSSTCEYKGLRTYCYYCYYWYSSRQEPTATAVDSRPTFTAVDSRPTATAVDRRPTATAVERRPTATAVDSRRTAAALLAAGR